MSMQETKLFELKKWRGEREEEKVSLSVGSEWEGTLESERKKKRKIWTDAEEVEVWGQKRC